ncbi:MAG: ribbon-helix-helix protein, CopG family [Acidobacteria bacterium]|nr:ribbon-helix-helix protein, CopG family [Acidobacteriota bacterium]
MKTVQMTIDEELIAEVDRAAAAQGKSRSAFIREALRAALAGAQERELEEQHRLAYQRQPVALDELGAWEAEQVWPD